MDKTIRKAIKAEVERCHGKPRKVRVSCSAPAPCSVHMGILVDAIASNGENVTGFLTGNGAGKYTQIIVNERVVAVLKRTVTPNIQA